MGPPASSKTRASTESFFFLRGVSTPDTYAPRQSTGKQKKTNDTTSRLFTSTKKRTGDWLASGLIHTACTYHTELLSIPDLIRSTLLHSVHLEGAVADTIRYIYNTYNIGGTELTRHLFVELLMGHDWYASLGKFLGCISTPSTGTTHEATVSVEFLQFRVDSLQMLLLLIPRIFFAKNDAYCLQQHILQWMTAHVPLSIFLKSLPPETGAVVIPNSRLPHIRLSVGTHILPDGMDQIVADLDFFNNVSCRELAHA